MSATTAPVYTPTELAELRWLSVQVVWEACEGIDAGETDEPEWIRHADLLSRVWAMFRLGEGTIRPPTERDLAVLADAAEKLDDFLTGLIGSGVDEGSDPAHYAVETARRDRIRAARATLGREAVS